MKGLHFNGQGCTNSDNSQEFRKEERQLPVCEKNKLAKQIVNIYSKIFFLFLSN